MAFGRGRGSKRSSSTSYASTATTVIFVALCVLGVWMLTSNSVVPPQTTTKTATTTAATDTSEIDNTSLSSTSDDVVISSSSNNNDEPQATKPGTASQKNDQTENEKSESKDDQAVFEDNPGRLPDDAIKTDDESQSGDHNNAGNKGKVESIAVEEKEKQRQGENQLSEESTMTQNQETEQIIQKSDESLETKQQQQGVGEQENSGENTEEQKAEKESEDSQGDAQEQKQHGNQNPMAENGQELLNQTMKEYEKEQRQQREEDAGEQKSSRDSQTEEDKPKETQQQQQQQEQEQEQEQGKEQKQTQERESNTDVTFSDSTREEQPTEKGFSKEVTQIEMPQNSTNDENAQQREQKQEEVEQKSDGTSPPEQEEGSNESNSGEQFPDGGNSSIPKESAESTKSWKTQASESKNEKKRQKDESEDTERINGYKWHLCNASAGPDYIPCLDNERAIKKLRSRKHFEHRERHCPDDPPTCLVPLPEAYKESIKWPKSRDKVWYHNVPHTMLAEFKGHQNWVKVTGEFVTFPGGGTQFIHGALHYIDFLQQSVPNIGWGKHTRVILDVGCGVASFGGYLFERNVLTMSLAPKDEHEAQVQFALERGIPAISAVMGSQRLPFPSRVFDIVHCARCRVPWHEEGGVLLLELNRMLRPGGYFVWSATPVYQKLQADVEIWQAMSTLTKSMCWELVTIKKDKLNGVAAAIYQKPLTNECYEKRQKNQPPMCNDDDDANAAWYVPLQACMHKVPVNPAERGSKWPVEWPRRLQSPPYWLNSSQKGIYGKPARQDFATDYDHWKQVVSKVYMNELGISWSKVRNVMDMRAVYGGFAAALKDLQVWVMNVVNINSPDTLPIIYERGLFGIYHDWCESFSTYPRSYDLLHADHLFSKLKERCKLAPVMAEVDRIVRPGGKLIVRDKSTVIPQVENLLKSLCWEVHFTFSKDQEGILSAQKGKWRPYATGASSLP